MTSHARKLMLVEAINHPHHAVAERAATDTLQAMLKNDENGVLRDTVIEKTFRRELDEAIARK